MYLRSRICKQEHREAVMLLMLPAPVGEYRVSGAHGLTMPATFKSMHTFALKQSTKSTNLLNQMAFQASTVISKYKGQCSGLPSTGARLSGSQRGRGTGQACQILNAGVIYIGKSYIRSYYKFSGHQKESIIFPHASPQWVLSHVSKLALWSMTCTIGGGWIEEDTLMYTRKRQSHVLCEAGCALAKVLTVVRVD